MALIVILPIIYYFLIGLSNVLNVIISFKNIRYGLSFFYKFKI